MYHSVNLIYFFSQKQAGTLQSLFRETHEQNAFNTYASAIYYHINPYDMYFGIKHNGKIKRAMKTHRVGSISQYNFVETTRKFSIAKLSICKLGSSSMLTWSKSFTIINLCGVCTKL